MGQVKIRTNAIAPLKSTGGSNILEHRGVGVMTIVLIIIQHYRILIMVSTLVTLSFTEWYYIFFCRQMPNL